MLYVSYFFVQFKKCPVASVGINAVNKQDEICSRVVLSTNYTIYYFGEVGL